MDFESIIQTIAVQEVFQIRSILKPLFCREIPLDGISSSQKELMSIFQLGSFHILEGSLYAN